MYMNTIQEVQPSPCPDHGELSFGFFPPSPKFLRWNMPVDIGIDGANYLWAIGKTIAPKHRVTWLNDVAIALRHGCPLNIAIGVGKHTGKIKPLWKRGR